MKERAQSITPMFNDLSVPISDCGYYQQLTQQTTIVNLVEFYEGFGPGKLQW
jgi:hypothetical protein